MLLREGLLAMRLSVQTNKGLWMWLDGVSRLNKASSIVVGDLWYVHELYVSVYIGSWLNIAMVSANWGMEGRLWHNHVSYVVTQLWLQNSTSLHASRWDQSACFVNKHILEEPHEHCRNHYRLCWSGFVSNNLVLEVIWLQQSWMAPSHALDPEIRASYWYSLTSPVLVSRNTIPMLKLPTTPVYHWS